MVFPLLVTSALYRALASQYAAGSRQAISTWPEPISWIAVSESLAILMVTGLFRVVSRWYFNGRNRSYIEPALSTGRIERIRGGPVERGETFASAFFGTRSL